MNTREPSNPRQDLSAYIELTRGQGVQVAEAARSVSRIAFEIADGSELQMRLLDTAASHSNEMTASMGESTRQMESIASFVEEIASSVNETAASTEQVGGMRPTLPPALRRLRRLPKRPRAPSTA